MRPLRTPLAPGSFILKDYGPDNINTWESPGEVRAVVDGHLVVRRRKGSGETFYQLIDPWEWTYGEDHLRVVPKPADFPREG